MTKDADILLKKNHVACDADLSRLFSKRMEFGHLGKAKAAHTIPKLTVRSLFISDLHLGMSGTECQDIQHLLENVACQNLIMIGDIIDGWALKRRWVWKATQEAALDAILMHAANADCDVSYIIGNHDEFFRTHTPSDAPGNIHFAPNMLFDLADGRRFWISHGDEFDAVTSEATWLSHAGSILYENSIHASKAFKRLQKKVGLPGVSISRELKNLMKHLVQPSGKFQELLSNSAEERNACGVICGHIHRPEITKTDAICYANTGDFVESSSAIIEDFNGRLSLIYWDHVRGLRKCIEESMPLA